MNRLILSVVLLLFAHMATGQCKLHSKKDDFTGAVSYWTRQVKIASDGVGLLAGQFDCKFKIFAHFVYGNSKAVLVLTEKEELCGCSPGSITFKFADGTVLTKANVRQGPSKSTGVSEYERYSFFDLTKEELALLSSKEIAKFRIKEMYCTDHSTVEADMNTKTAEHMREAAQCILNATK